MRFPEPLFWILDALYEVDSHSITVRHFTKIESLNPIRLFITGRPMKISSASFYGSSVTTHILSQNNTLEDIRVYFQRRGTRCSAQ